MQQLRAAPCSVRSARRFWRHGSSSLAPWLGKRNAAWETPVTAPAPSLRASSASWSAPPFGFPNGVGTAPGGTIHVAELPHRVLHYDADGTFLGTWGSEGNGPGAFGFPADVAVAPNGTLYVADAGNHRIQAFRVAR